MIKYLKSNILVIILMLLFLGFGILAFFIEGDDVFLAFSIVAMLYLFMIGSWMIYSSIKQKDILNQNTGFINRPVGYFIQGLLFIAAGITIVIFRNFLVRLIVGVFLIVLPLISLILSKNKKEYFKKNFWKFIVGIIFVIANDLIFEIIFKIIGAFFIVDAIFLLYLLIRNYRRNPNTNIISRYLMKYIALQQEKVSYEELKPSDFEYEDDDNG